MFNSLFSGIGVANVIRLFIHSIYFNVMVAYSIYYAFASLKQPYSWGRCDVNWTTSVCDNVTWVSLNIYSLTMLTSQCAADMNKNNGNVHTFNKKDIVILT